MRERAKKSPFYVAYADRKPSHRKPSHAKEKTSQTVLRVYAYVTEPKKSQPKSGLNCLTEFWQPPTTTEGVIFFDLFYRLSSFA